MAKCDFCGNSNNVVFVKEHFGFSPGVHLCEVCRPCFKNELKGGSSEAVNPISVSTQPAHRISFENYPGSIIQKLLPRLLD